MVGAVVFFAWVIAAYGAVWAGLPVLVWVLRPLLIRVAPSDMFGPEGWFIDTKNKTGILDFGLQGRRGAGEGEI